MSGRAHAGSRPRLAAARAERGQATIELLGALPVVLVVGLAAAQLLAVGYSAVLAGTAAEAGALARATGGDAERGARASLPGWSEARARVRVEGDTVKVALRPPSLLAMAARALEVEGRAAVAG